MKNISIINEFTNSFNKSFKQNLNHLYLESKIRNVGDNYIRNDLIDDLKLLFKIGTLIKIF